MKNDFRSYFELFFEQDYTATLVLDEHKKLLLSNSKFESEKEYFKNYLDNISNYRNGTIFRDYVVRERLVNIEESSYSLVKFIPHEKEAELQEIFDKQKLIAELASEANIMLEKEITRHKQTQLELENSQEISKSVFNSSLDVIISSNLEFRITEISPSGLDAFGYELGELPDLHIKEIYASEEEFLRIRKELTEKRYFRGEVMNKTKSGKVFTSFLSCSAMENYNGDVIGFMGISRDISKEKEAEDKLLKSEKKFRELFYDLHDGILVLDEHNNIKDANLMAMQLLGINDYQGHNLRDFIAPENEVKFDNAGKSLRANGAATQFEFIFQIGEEKKHILLNTKAIYRNGKFAGSQDIIRDISPQKRAENIIKSQNQKLQSIFENKSGIMFWTMDQDFRITSKNSALDDYFFSFLERTLNVGDNFLETLEPYLGRGIFPSLERYFKEAMGGRIVDFEGVLKNRETEKEKWIHTFINPINGINGEVEVACMGIDITQVKQNQIRISKSLEEKDILLKEVHHRVKNNLQVISSILNLQSSYVKDEGTLNILRESQNRVKSMSYVHEILYNSKDFTEVNFKDYITNLTNNILHTFLPINPNIKLDLDLDNLNLNLDQAIPCGLIVNELVTNSMKYAFDGVNEPTLKVVCKESKGKVFLEIYDNGVGLPVDFDLKNSDSLGLQLVFTLIEQLDGQIELLQGKGTKYLINFVKLTNPKIGIEYEQN